MDKAYWANALKCHPQSLNELILLSNELLPLISGVHFMGYDDNESLMFDESSLGQPEGVRLTNYTKFKNKYVSNIIPIKCNRLKFKILTARRM